MNSRTRLFISLLLSFSLILTAVFGVVISMPMAAGGAMPMSHCLIMGSQAGLCPMSALEHLVSWNHLFSTIPGLILVVGILLGVRVFLRNGVDKDKMRRPQWRFYVGRHFIRKLFDILIVALRRGIIQPRLYDAVIS